MANGRELGVPLSKMPELKTWDKVNSWADMLDASSKNIIREALASIPKERQCPYLRTIVENNEVQWTYCQIRRDELESRGCPEGDKPAYSDPRYNSAVDCAFLQLFCANRSMRDDEEIRFKKCIEYLAEEGKKRRESEPRKID